MALEPAISTANSQTEIVIDPLAGSAGAGPMASAETEGPVRPTRWYQWFILYPALAVALLGAVPGWITKAQEVYLGLSKTNSTLAEATRLDSLIRKNAACLDSPRNWVTTEELKVDGTICPSGDLMVWVSKGPQEFVDFFETDRLFENKMQQTAGSLFSMQALASTPAPVSVRPPASSSLLLVQDPFAITICQSFPDDRTLVRHLQVGDQCYDETIDTYTGVVVGRNPVPCRSSC